MILKKNVDSDPVGPVFAAHDNKRPSPATRARTSHCRRRSPHHQRPPPPPPAPSALPQASTPSTAGARPSYCRRVPPPLLARAPPPAGARPSSCRRPPPLLSARTPPAAGARLPCCSCPPLCWKRFPPPPRGSPPRRRPRDGRPPASLRCWVGSAARCTMRPISAPRSSTPRPPRPLPLPPGRGRRRPRASQKRPGPARRRA